MASAKTAAAIRAAIETALDTGSADIAQRLKAILDRAEAAWQADREARAKQPPEDPASVRR